MCRLIYGLKMDVVMDLIGKYKSRRQICLQAGLCRNTLRGVLRRGRCYPQTVECLAKVFGVAPEELVEQTWKSLPPQLREKPYNKRIKIKRNRLLGAILTEMSCGDFAKKSGLHYGSLMRILRKRSTTVKTLERICAALGRNAEEFIEEEF